MKNVAIVYYSGYGHTKKVAEHIKIGVNNSKEVHAVLISVDELEDVDALNDYKRLYLVHQHIWVLCHTNLKSLWTMRQKSG